MNSILKSSSRTKSNISSWISVFFALFLFAAAVMTEVFQLTKSNDIETAYSNPIKSDILANLKSVVIKNRLGQFTLQEEVGRWMLKEPRIMPLKESTKQKLFQALQAITVKDIHQYEPINLSSFSLDRPILSIALYTKLDEKITLNMGLINPINNTTYITVSNQKNIFQVDLLKDKIESLELTDFIDAKVFSVDVNQVKSFALYRGNSTSPAYQLQSKDGQWTSMRFKHISNNNTLETISKILNIRAHYILDKKDEETLNTITNYLENPLYRIVLKTDTQELSYKLSPLVRSIPGIKLEKRQNFIIQASDRIHPYIVDK